MVREVDGIRVAFVASKGYFASLATQSMVSTARDTGADLVLLLAPGKTEADLSDDEIRALLELVHMTKDQP